MIKIITCILLLWIVRSLYQFFTKNTPSTKKKYNNPSYQSRKGGLDIKDAEFKDID